MKCLFGHKWIYSKQKFYYPSPQYGYTFISFRVCKYCGKKQETEVGFAEDVKFENMYAWIDSPSLNKHSLNCLKYEVRDKKLKELGI